MLVRIHIEVGIECLPVGLNILHIISCDYEVTVPIPTGRDGMCPIVVSQSFRAPGLFIGHEPHSGECPELLLCGMVTFDGQETISDFQRQIQQIVSSFDLGHKALLSPVSLRMSSSHVPASLV